MRAKYLFAPLAPALALALATPALAQDEGDIWADDPYAEQDDMVLAVDELVGALLDMPVGRIANALPPDIVDRDMEIRPGDTVRDMALREDPNFEENVRGGARAMTSVVGNMVREFTAIIPELEAMAGRLGRTLGD